MTLPKVYGNLKLSVLNFNMYHHVLSLSVNALPTYSTTMYKEEELITFSRHNVLFSENLLKNKINGWL